MIDAERFSDLPAEVALRLLGRAIAQAGNEGPVELGKLEALYAALARPRCGREPARLRRTLAGALVTLAGDRIDRRTGPAAVRPRRQQHRLTTRQHGRRSRSKRR